VSLLLCRCIRTFNFIMVPGTNACFCRWVSCSFYLYSNLLLRRSIPPGSSIAPPQTAAWRVVSGFLEGSGEAGGGLAIAADDVYHWPGRFVSPSSWMFLLFFSFSSYMFRHLRI